MKLVATRHCNSRAIPTLYSSYEVCEALQLLGMEPVDAIPEDEQTDQTLRRNIRAALQRIHYTGFVHDDIAR